MMNVYIITESSNIVLTKGLKQCIHTVLRDNCIWKPATSLHLLEINCLATGVIFSKHQFSESGKRIFPFLYAVRSYKTVVIFERKWHMLMLSSLHNLYIM